MTHTGISLLTNDCSSSDKTISGIMARFMNVDSALPVTHCEACGTPTQRDIEILGLMRRVPILCQCRSDELAHEKKIAEMNDLRRRLERFKAYSLMDSRFEVSTFTNWQHRVDNQSDYTLGLKYCEHWESMLTSNRGLLLYGKAGSGKTYLSFAIANELYQQGKAVMAISISKLLAIIKDSFDSSGDYGETDVLNTVRDASLLILDDIGVEYKTAWSYEKLYAIIDTRYRANKPVIITTNFSLDALRENLATVDYKSRLRDPSERVFSRITEMCVFHEIKGASWRISKGANNKANLYGELGISP